MAVAPIMRLASAVSCTPGSCTTTRSSPWRWITGSATPTSSTRLRRVVMFWSIASIAIWSTSASGTRVVMRFPLTERLSVGWSAAISCIALLTSASSDSTVWMVPSARRSTEL